MSEIERLAQAVGLSAQQRELLAALLTEEGIDLEGEAPIPLLQGQRDLRLSFAQQRIWFLQRLEPESPFYNIGVEVRLTGVLDVPVLGRALAEVARRHETLRTTFVERDGEPRVRVAPPGAVALPLVDLGGLPRAAVPRLVGELTLCEARRGFDLTAGPLLRLLLLRLPRREHRVIVTLHHTIADGWSLSVLIHEIGTLYGAFLRGGRSPLPELPFQYSDYAAWQREWLQGAVLEKELAYWRGKLAGADPVLELPFDSPRPAQLSRRGAKRVLLLPAALVQSADRLSRREGASLFMILLAAFLALLGRYSGQRRLVIGYPVANRTRSDIEGLIGLFLNTLVLRVDFSHELTVRDLLGRVRVEVLEAQSHSELPFERLVEELQPQRNLSHNPLFQALFVLQNTPVPALEIPGLSVSATILDLATAQFDLSFAFEKSGEALLGRLEYSTDLFAATTIERLFEHYRNLLMGFVATPGAEVGAVPILGPGERHQLLAEWNDVALPGAAPALALHHLFATQVARAPEALAVICAGAALTYGELDRRAEQLARRLRRLGVEPEEVVGVCLERSLALVVALLGVLKAGGAYLPLDPSYPRERLELLIADAATPVIVTEEEVAATLPAGKAALVLLNSGDGGTCEAAVPFAVTDPGVRPENLAYVIYTSGSTGRPRGVQVTHGNVARLLAATAPWFRFGPGDVWTLFHSFAFDFSVWEMWGALAYGGTLVVVPYWVSRSPESFCALLGAAGVTVLNQTPSAFRQLTRVEAEGDGRVLAALRLVIFGGEALEVESLRPWVARHGAECPVLVNMYGITETTVHVTYRRLVAGDVAGRCGSMIGRPLPDLGVSVVDASLALQPIGIAGELCVAGAGLARGYAGGPELTAARFVPHPWGGEPGARLYRSGDLVRRLPDGDLEYLGRIDHQVKVRGFRIELGEIESALGGEPGVREAVVIAREDGPGDRRLVAYVVAGPEGFPGAEVLREALRRKLPEYMVPSAVVALPALPLTANGKVDRRALPAPEGAVPRGEGRPPRGPLEEMLAGIWSEVLRIERVGAEDDFFALGGHSLLAAQVVSRVLRDLGVELPLKVIFESPTVASLALRLAALGHSRLAAPLSPDRGGAATHSVRGADAGGDSLGRQETDDSAVRRLAEAVGFSAQQKEMLASLLAEEGIDLEGEQPNPLPTLSAGLPAIVRQVTPSAEGWPLSFSQERLWFLDQFEPGNAAYNIPAAFRLRGRLDAEALAASLGEVARRHGSLRTVFRAGSRGAVQVVEPHVSWTLPRVDLSRLAPASREGELEKLVEREARAPFDLARGPLWRARLVTLGEDDAALQVTFHHIVSDGWSVAVLVREVVALYRVLVSAEKVPSPLPELPIQYTDYACWQRQWLRSDGLARGLAYWRQQLLEIPVLVLPTDRPRPAVQTFAGAQEPLRLGLPRSRALLQLARQQNATPFMVFLAGFAALLARYTAQDDLGVGTFVANRTRPEIEGLIGFFLNNLALRVRLAGDPTFGELLTRARETAFDAFAVQDVPFEAVLDELRPERSLSHPPFFQVMLVLQNAPREEIVLGDVTLAPLPVASKRANFDLTLWLSEEAEGFMGSLEYNRDLFERTTIVRWAGHLQALLDAASGEPASRLATLPLLGGEERWQILGEWSRGPAPVPGGRSVLELFAARAAAAPDAVALVAPLADRAGERNLTYSELARAAAGLARRLAQAGVGPESAVGVALARSPELLVALLGIWAAGGFYVPLDLSSPPERQALLLADAGARVVVTARRPDSPWPAAERVEIFVDELSPGPARPLEPPVSLRQLAYAIYTSGSTGKPKGVLVEHHSLAHHTADAAAFFALAPADRVLQFAAVSFDASAEEIWPCLTSGATLVLRSDEMIASPRQLLARCSELGITVLDLPTAYWHEVVAALAAASTALPSSLRLVILGGERARPESWAAWRSRAAASVRLVNTYGPTEATVVATRCELSALPPTEAGREVPIGRAISGTQAYVLAPDLTPLPAGIPGELCLGGAGLARGYLDRPDLTAERFVPDPLATVASGRLYRTGDLARYRSDGQLDFGGRVDQQVKVRGFRVEPGEIETVLAAYPAVAAAVVTARDDLPGGSGLAAYLVPRQGEELELDALRDFLGERLPEYMLPAAFVVLASLPLRASGKVDRRALPAPERGRAEERGFVAPRTPVESLLAEIWSDLLGRDRIGAFDSFFKLGGHSLIATQLVSRLHGALAVEVPLRTLFEAPTLAEMALAVEELVIARLDGLSEEELVGLE